MATEESMVEGSIEELLYPCGIDVVGIALRDDGSQRQIISDVVPYVISTTFMIPKGKILDIHIQSRFLYRPSTIHATGPCELVSVKHRQVEYLNSSPFARWCFVHKSCDVHEYLNVKIRCCPDLFMLRDVLPTVEDIVQVSGPEFFPSE